MSYETHVTMLINCFTVSVRVYAALTIIESCLGAIVVAAKHVPPADFLSLLFNVWFGCLTLAILKIMHGILLALFFPDTTHEMLTQPEFSVMHQNQDGSAYKCSIHKYRPELIGITAFFLKNSSEPKTDGVPPSAKPSEPTTTSQSPQVHATQAAQSAQPFSKSMSPPDSEARSQASTETDPDDKEEIKPVA